MKRELIVVFIAAVVLYLPASRYGFVQDDRAIIASNPAAHSIGAALGAFEDPYWPRESGAGLYRPVTILSYAVDWTISGGRAGWLHVMNALWHGLATVLFVCVIARWLPPVAATGAGLVFAWHPVHVEAVASLVGRAELLAAVGILGAILAARRGWWIGAVVCAALAMLSKEHGVVVGVVILFDKWLEASPPGGAQHAAPLKRGEIWFWVAIATVTIGYLVAWSLIGRAGASDTAAVLFGRGFFGRWAIALPAVLRAAVLLSWPVSLSSDYSPRVIPAYSGMSLAATLGLCIAIAVPIIMVRCRRRAPLISFATGLAALSYLPTSNLLFPSGVILAERNLYLAVAVPAAMLGVAAAWLEAKRGLRPAIVAIGVLAAACGTRSLVRLPAWRDNRAQLLTLLEEHPESYRAHASAAAVSAGLGDTAGARRQYEAADSLFAGDPYLTAAHAIFLLDRGDTAGAAPLVARLRTPAESAPNRAVWRARFLFELRRGDRKGATVMADSAKRYYPSDSAWYRPYLQ
ncbi:MAG TPA: hypothetical protein VGU74_04575 [Gemmatimonadales bacterium]|nr:hypothetical protein [Gemmatimonadales bacterium]